MKIKLLKGFLTISLIIVTFFSAIQAHTSLIWAEDFEDGELSEWDSKAWQMIFDVHSTPIDPGFSVMDGVLRTPNYSSFGKKARIIRDSTVAYGTWSFDLLVSSKTQVGIEFVFTDLRTNYDFTGLLETQGNFTGYAVLLVAFSRGINLGLQAPGINLLKFINRDNTSLVEVLDTHPFSADVVGTHHIDIIRTSQGQISVYFDSEITLFATDNFTTSSEKFGITTWRGDSGIDNIQISDTPTPVPTNPTSTTAGRFVLWLLISSFVVLLIFRKKVKL